jgi:nitrite reductase/ring-hydroxylating ferredoxin subunit
MAEFVKVANLSDLPAGRALAVEVNGKAIALFNVA